MNRDQFRGWFVRWLGNKLRQRIETEQCKCYSKGINAFYKMFCSWPWKRIITHGQAESCDYCRKFYAEAFLVIRCVYFLRETA